MIVSLFFIIKHTMDYSKNKLYDFLSGYITEERKGLFEKIISQRTRYITVVLEEIFHSQNASAVLRTCECLGIQDVHIIDSKQNYNINPDVVLGSNQWLSLNIHSEKENNTLSAIKKLKEEGYRIIATSPHKNDKDVDSLNLDDGKIALFFGNELEGLSEEMQKVADEFVKIPMCGFTESFNISVSAGIILYELSSKLRKSAICWQLSENERIDLLIHWVKNSIKTPELYIKEFEKRLIND